MHMASCYTLPLMTVSCIYPSFGIVVPLMKSQRVDCLTSLNKNLLFRVNVVVVVKGCGVPQRSIVGG